MAEVPQKPSRCQPSLYIQSFNVNAQVAQTLTNRTAAHPGEVLITEVGLKCLAGGLYAALFAACSM